MLDGWVLANLLKLFGLENKEIVNFPYGIAWKRPVFLVLTWEVCESESVKTIFHLCVPKKYLAKSNFYYQLHIYRTEL